MGLLPKRIPPKYACVLDLSLHACLSLFPLQSCCRVRILLFSNMHRGGPLYYSNTYVSLRIHELAMSYFGHKLRSWRCCCSCVGLLWRGRARWDSVAKSSSLRTRQYDVGMLLTRYVGAAPTENTTNVRFQVYTLITGMLYHVLVSYRQHRS